MPEDPEQLRAELREIGDRRRRLNTEIEKLALDTARAIKRSRRANLLSVTEVALLIDLHRTYVYRGFPR